MALEGEKKHRVIKANKTLQAKAGTGPLDTKAVERSERVMENNDVDFAPLALEFLDNLMAAIKTAKADPAARNNAATKMTAEVMQLKANAATFKYTLISQLANIMLSFLERINEIDDEAIQIVEAHHTTLKAIVLKKLTGDGGAPGKAMQEELQKACQRYFAKRK